MFENTPTKWHANFGASRLPLLQLTRRHARNVRGVHANLAEKHERSRRDGNSGGVGNVSTPGVTQRRLFGSRFLPQLSSSISFSLIKLTRLVSVLRTHVPRVFAGW